MKYFYLFKICFEKELRSKISILIKVLTQILWGIMKILLFYAFYKSSNNFPIRFSSCVSYIWLEQIFLNFFASWTIRKDTFEIIEDGDIICELMKPNQLYFVLFFKDMSSRLSYTIITGLIIFFIVYLLPYPYNLSLPLDLRKFSLFLVSLFLGFLIFLALIMIMYTCSFYITASNGIKNTFVAIVEFFSGRIIPLTFFPDKLNTVIQFMPFAYIQNLCFRIYSENLTYNYIFKGLVIQIFWIITLVVLGNLFIKKALIRLIKQGG